MRFSDDNILLFRQPNPPLTIAAGSAAPLDPPKPWREMTALPASPRMTLRMISSTAESALLPPAPADPTLRPNLAMASSARTCTSSGRTVGMT